MLSLGWSLGLLLIAFVLTSAIYPWVLSYAVRHRVLDNPNERKLQRVPVPVMGGVAVWLGAFVTAAVSYAVVPNPRAFWIIGILTVMFGIGVWDDVKNISAWLRFLVEIFVVWVMILALDVEINDFHGLWGLHEIPDTWSMPLSLIAGVGIINAVNLIDGVDGYCSSYGIMACLGFAIAFHIAGAGNLVALALGFAGALIPFFLHNVFGRRSKMFLGDGGSLMLGTLLTYFVFSLLTSGGPCERLDIDGLSPVAFSLGILAVPVFDTLRVMTSRIVRGLSPFHPDKTHLHHLFIDLNFSHLATSSIIVTANFLLVLVLLAAWKLGLGVNGQVYLVITMGLLFTTVFYYWMRRQEPSGVNDEGTALFRRIYRLGARTHLGETLVWTWLRNLSDSRLLGGPAAAPPRVETSDPSVRPDPRIRD